MESYHHEPMSVDNGIYPPSSSSAEGFVPDATIPTSASGISRTTTTSSTSGTPSGTPRASRTISELCRLIREELTVNGPLTRDELAKRTEFSRQRICTVLSVYKAIGLINEAPERKIGLQISVKWNSKQELVLQNLPEALARLSEAQMILNSLDAEEAALAAEEAQLLTSFSSGAHSGR